MRAVNAFTASKIETLRIARLRDAIGGAVWSARIASSAALFHSVTTSARARGPVRSAVEAHQQRNLKVFICRNEVAFVVCLSDWKFFFVGPPIH
jgi:hypothetical protein